MKSKEIGIESMMDDVAEGISELEALLFANKYNSFFSQVILFTEKLLGVVQKINSIQTIDEELINEFNYLLVRMTDHLGRKDYVEIFDIIHFELMDILYRMIN